MTHAVGVIPARLGSTRLPEKVLLDRTGKPLVQHVYEAARQAKLLSRVVVATDSERVVRAVEAFGGEALMTSPDHLNGTSRVGEVASLLRLHDTAMVVNIQGDEPEMDAGAIDAVVRCLSDAEAPMATIASPFFPGEDSSSPAMVKVVMRRDGRALYFSRSFIPHPRTPITPHAHGHRAGTPPCKHVGLYAYRKWFLDRYKSLAPGELEAIEVLEQLRVLEHGFDIQVAMFPTKSQGIDLPDQYEAFVRRYLG
ncbi:MAG: 3-deoxy-manno-octulosonate cytidylyltransferase [Planctomycetota bacterium]|nr:3-deoxy-manno-octulosonate cytidylyltransferase [Planctomycetota bacterium]